MRAFAPAVLVALFLVACAPSPREPSATTHAGDEAEAVDVGVGPTAFPPPPTIDAGTLAPLRIVFLDSGQGDCALIQ